MSGFSLRISAGSTLLALIGGLLLAPSAVATPGDGRVTAREDGGTLTVSLSASDVDGKARDLREATDIEVEAAVLGGRPQTLTYTRVTDPGQAAAVLNRQVLLLVDISGSMKLKLDGRRKKIDVAKAAVRTYLDSLPANVKVGLVTFGDKATPVLPPTADHDAVMAKINGITIDDDQTGLYTGVQAAVNQLRATKGDRRILLLSDGAASTFDLKSEPAAKAALASVTDVPLTAIAFGAGSDRGQLEKLAAINKGGLVVDAGNVDGLTAAFRDARNQVQNQLVVTAPVPADLGSGQGSVSIRAMIDGEEISGTGVTVIFPPAAPTGPSALTPVVSSSPFGAIDAPVLYAALVALFVGLSVIVATAGGMFTRFSSHETEVMRRLSIYTVDSRDPRRLALKEQATVTAGESPLRRSTINLLGRLVKGRGLDDGLDARLDAAGVPMSTAEWMLLHIGATVGTALVFLLLGRGRLVAALVGLVIGFAVPWFVLSIRTSRRRSAFLAQLPDTLQALAGSLRTGYSLPQAMDAVIQEASPPMSTEFSRSLVETRLGMAAEDALEGIAERTGSKDFSWIVMAIRIQRQVGGNLAELLTSVAETLRERERLRGQVRALSAEGRLSAWILGLLPVVFTAYLLVARPEYLLPMFASPVGVILLIGGASLVAVGSLWMRKTVTVEV